MPGNFARFSYVQRKGGRVVMFNERVMERCDLLVEEASGGEITAQFNFSHIDEEVTCLLHWFSNAGEDVNEEFDFDGTVNDFVKKLQEFNSDFEAVCEENAKMWIDGPGAPDLFTLVEDARDKVSFFNDFTTKLSSLAERSLGDRGSNANDSVKLWYKSNYPEDDWAFDEIDESISFLDIANQMNNGEDFYEIIGVADSMVRERIFTEMADVFDLTFEDVYEAWSKKHPLPLEKDARTNSLDSKETVIRQFISKWGNALEGESADLWELADGTKVFAHKRAFNEEAAFYQGNTWEQIFKDAVMENLVEELYEKGSKMTIPKTIVDLLEEEDVLRHMYSHYTFDKYWMYDKVMLYTPERSNIEVPQEYKNVFRNLGDDYEILSHLSLLDDLSANMSNIISISDEMHYVLRHSISIDSADYDEEDIDNYRDWCRFHEVTLANIQKYFPECPDIFEEQKEEVEEGMEL